MKTSVQGDARSFEVAVKKHAPRAELPNSAGGFPALAVGFRCRQRACTMSLKLLTFRARWKAGIDALLLFYERAL